ncbi:MULTISPECIES: SU10 major capsid protein [Mycetohabitans]|uniref:SU10 major capsid protein n=1 Tax=Mycetohabitans TaxID=2571159 RepID=UPI001F3CB7F6|nr:DUF5309 family protein [Mycetohabitans sp. B3]MCF2133875.1 DUF5309 domain-containing protein [Mycetohabitans sp. B3]
MANNTYTTYQAIGNREDLIDKIFSVAPTDTPFISAIGRTSAKAVHHEWQRDTLRKPNKANAAQEGAPAAYTQQTPTQRLGNRTQIIQDTLSISGTQSAVRHAGGSEEQRLKAKKMVELKKDIEAAAIANTAQVAGNGAGVRQMCGLAGWIATNNNLGKGGVAPDPIKNVAPKVGEKRDFSEELLQDAILQAYTQGGDVTMAIMRPRLKQQASAFEGNAQRVVDVGSNVRAATMNVAYTFYGSDFGVVKLVPNRVMADGVDDNVYGIDPKMWKLAFLRGFHSEELAKTGDARNFQILCEVTLEACEERSSFAIRDLN